MLPSAVWFDHRSGGRLATQHLLDLGHRRIAHIAGPANRTTSIHRRQGYEAALVAAGIPLQSALVATGDYSFPSGERLMRQLWRERPTAVFVAGDAMALGALRALSRLGVRVPDDLSLVAFGNPDFVRYATPAITTVDLPVAQRAKSPWSWRCGVCNGPRKRRCACWRRRCSSGRRRPHEGEKEGRGSLRSGE